MTLVDKLIKLLKEKHGEDLDLKKDSYYLFLQGAMFNLYYDEDKRSLQVHVEFLPVEDTYIYFSDLNIEDIMDKEPSTSEDQKRL